MARFKIPLEENVKLNNSKEMSDSDVLISQAYGSPTENHVFRSWSENVVCMTTCFNG